jgi:DNA-binding TFAR19-related protein (PDSD5 family)
MVRPDNARKIEEFLLSSAELGHIRGKIDEDDLILVIEKVCSTTERKNKIEYKRRDTMEEDFSE